MILGSYKNVKLAKRHVIAIFFVLIYFLSFSTVLLAKPKDLGRLEADKKKLIKEISKVQKLISSKEKNYKKTLSQINVINSQIARIIKIIQSIDIDLHDIDKQITKRSSIIAQLHQDLEKLQKEYSDSLHSAYKVKQKLDSIPYILFSDSYQQYYRKFSSFKFYIRYRKNHLIDIENSYKKLSLEKNRYEQHKKIQTNLLKTRKKEMSDLESLKFTHDKLSEKLQKEKVALVDELEKKRKNISRLNSAINKIIQDNIAKQEAERKARAAQEAAEKQKRTESSTKLVNFKNTISDSNTRLGKSFASSKGKIPWPVSKGLITGKFGTHTHPNFKNVQVCNLGINIQTEAKAKVCAVFEGKVVSVMRMPGMQNIVVVAHGEYHTVYIMLDNVTIKEGDNVKCGDILGRSSEDGTGYSEVQFQIWQHGAKVNPEDWLKK